jgi:uncharacterized protein
MKPEYKTFSLKFDDIDTQGKIRGYASTFGNIDYGYDVVDKGAFKKSIRETKGLIPILADHDPRAQIGWNLRAEEDDKGLLIEGELNLDIQKAREKYALAKKALEIGAKMGLSIGYMTIKAEPDKTQGNVRRLKELKLIEYSLVTFPMNAEAMVTAAKSLGALDRANFLINHLKSEGIATEELALALSEQAVKVDYDPTKIGQSIDDLIKLFKS